MIKKISNIFLVILFTTIISFADIKADPEYAPSIKSQLYISIGWTVESTWLGDRWFIHAYDPDNPQILWDDYEE